MFRRTHPLTKEVSELNAPGYVIHLQRKVFCFYCRLFSAENELVSGFHESKTAASRIEVLKKSVSHRSLDVAFVQTSVQESIDKDQEIAIRSAACHWKSNLQLALDLILYCTEYGLPLPGYDEKFGSATNGSFIGLLELIAEYDSFLVSHIAIQANLGSERSSYLS